MHILIKVKRFTVNLELFPFKTITNSIFCFTYRSNTLSKIDVSKNVIKSDNLNPTSQKITDNTKTTSNKETNTESATGTKLKDVQRKSQTSSGEAKKSSPTPDKREDLTALKALDVLLRRYDRRSTPTNDLGTISCSFLWEIQLTRKVYSSFWR